jgi:hypothetical protein
LTNENDSNLQPANGIQNWCNVGTNTAINVNATDNTATKTAASESSKPSGRQPIGTDRHQRARGGSLNEQSCGRLVISRLTFVIRRQRWSKKMRPSVEEGGGLKITSTPMTPHDRRPPTSWRLTAAGRGVI